MNYYSIFRNEIIEMKQYCIFRSEIIAILLYAIIFGFMKARSKYKLTKYGGWGWQ